jgi:uncharacterized protein YoxC
MKKEGFQSENKPSQTSSQSPSPCAETINVLAYKNAGNIEVLDGRVSKLEDLVPDVKKLSNEVNQLSKQVRAMATAKMTPVINAGNKAKPITGL